MKLYDLVTLKQALIKNLNKEPVVNSILELCTNLNNIKTQVDELDEASTSYIDQLVNYYKQLISQLDAPDSLNQEKIENINNEITQRSFHLYTHNFDLETQEHDADYVRTHRKLTLTEDVEQAAKQRILLYTSWRYPALEIGCRDGDWTQYLIAADPLYIMDKYPEFLSSTNSRFPQQYQNRLRSYQLVNNDFGALPQNQFAFVFSWAFFNYMSLDSTTQILRQVKELLRPGGICMFSYNNGDTPAGAGMAENFSQSYLPKSILIPTCRSLGFEIVDTFDYDPYASWIEIRKPGVLHTSKAHQVLGEIIRR
jgi:SAM-dependent methyltransferase